MWTCEVNHGVSSFLVFSSTIIDVGLHSLSMIFISSLSVPYTPRGVVWRGLIWTASLHFFVRKWSSLYVLCRPTFVTLQTSGVTHLFFRTTPLPTPPRFPPPASFFSPLLILLLILPHPLINQKVSRWAAISELKWLVGPIDIYFGNSYADESN